MDVEGVLADLIGRRCFSALIGPGVEFAISLHLGDKQRRLLRLPNPRLSFVERTYEGSHCLLVECVWRIDGPEGVIASCFDKAKPVGPRTDAVEGLVDRAVENVKVVRPAFDLEVSFEGGRVLRCFANEVDEKGKRNNWSYSCPFATATVGLRGALTLQTAVAPYD